MSSSRRKTRKQGGKPPWGQRPWGQRPWGQHLIIYAFDCDPKALRSRPMIAEFSKSLVNAIDMVAFGPPRIVHFGSGHTKGYTLVQLIETSNITAHFAEDSNSIFLDVFSCKPFNKEIALRVFRDYFNPSHMKTRFLNRG